MLEMDQYQDEAKRLAIYNPEHEVSYLALGLCGEAGEVANKIKKNLRGDGELPKMEIAYELGDCLWYLSTLADALGYQLSDIASMNLNKLISRKNRKVLAGDGDNR